MAHTTRDGRLVQDVADAIAADDDREAALLNPWRWIKLQRARSEPYTRAAVRTA